MNLFLTHKLDTIRLKMRRRSDHEIYPFERISIYKAFGVQSKLNNNISPVEEIRKNGFLVLEEADRILMWLAVLTAQKAIPLWEHNRLVPFKNTNSDDPASILKTAKNIINDTNKILEVYEDLCNKFFDGIAGCEDSTTEKGFYAGLSAYSALKFIICGFKSFNYSLEKINLRDNELSLHQHDFASLAMKAYSSIDHNKPGVWKEKDRNNKSYRQIIFSYSKRLEFWEWWLTEAIPQAWQLAQQSSSQKVSVNYFNS